MSITPPPRVPAHLLNFGLVMATGDGERLKLISCFVLGAFEVMHRVVQQGVLTVYATPVPVSETRYAH